MNNLSISSWSVWGNSEVSWKIVYSEFYSQTSPEEYKFLFENWMMEWRTGLYECCIHCSHLSSRQPQEDVWPHLGVKLRLLFLPRLLLSHQLRSCMLRCNADVDRKVTEQTFVIYTGLWNHFGRERRKMREEKEHIKCHILCQTLGLQMISFHSLKTPC